ncbi:hypothetical protein OAM67_00160 [bacterium]|nr:hypothetical protein [bacterium]
MDITSNPIASKRVHPQLLNGKKLKPVQCNSLVSLFRKVNKQMQPKCRVQDVIYKKQKLQSELQWRRLPQSIDVRVILRSADIQLQRLEAVFQTKGVVRIVSHNLTHGRDCPAVALLDSRLNDDVWAVAVDKNVITKRYFGQSMFRCITVGDVYEQLGSPSILGLYIVQNVVPDMPILNQYLIPALKEAGEIDHVALSPNHPVVELP